ncbi:hypothetical protein [Alteraurantiacibacter aquimixticola]|nr:hypothetical protein [Alteraurantiacibacter aquimixticola]
MNTAPATTREDSASRERRAHMLAYDLWGAACANSRFPTAEAVLDNKRCFFGDQALVIRFQETDGRDAQVVSIGQAIGEGIDCPTPVAKVPSRSLASRITAHFLEAVANQSPVGFEAQFEDSQDRSITYRAIALPCASDGKTIDTVLGVISFRVGAPDGPEDAGMDWPGDNPEGASPTLEKAPETSGSKSTSQEARKVQFRRIIMSYQDKLDEIMEIDGAIATALVDMDSGMALATSGNPKGLDLEVAAAGNTNVMKAKMNTMADLGLKENIEDILITLDSQIHMIRPATSESGKGLFIYVALDKKKANLAMARHKLRIVEKGIEI